MTELNIRKEGFKNLFFNYDCNHVVNQSVCIMTGG